MIAYGDVHIAMLADWRMLSHCSSETYIGLVSQVQGHRAMYCVCIYQHVHCAVQYDHCVTIAGGMCAKRERHQWPAHYTFLLHLVLLADCTQYIAVHVLHNEHMFQNI